MSLGVRQPDQPQAEPDIFVVSGIPAKMCELNPNSRTLTVGHMSLGCVSLSREHWPTNPEEAISPDADLFLHYTQDLAIDERGKR